MGEAADDAIDRELAEVELDLEAGRDPFRWDDRDDDCLDADPGIGGFLWRRRS